MTRVVFHLTIYSFIKHLLNYNYKSETEVSSAIDLSTREMSPAFIEHMLEWDSKKSKAKTRISNMICATKEKS